jgi:hypothetical protein
MRPSGGARNGFPCSWVRVRARLDALASITSAIWPMSLRRSPMSVFDHFGKAALAAATAALS